ncbi:MAG: methyltransferase [Sphingobium sp. 66-54]|nr:MAG: methyltransferase [Sphingobium sp. 66-54]
MTLAAPGRDLAVPVGTGRNLALVARHYPKARLVGLDISSEMLRSAEAAIARAGAHERTLLGRADAAAFDPQRLFGEPGFDRVFISYSLSMIPDWERALTQALSVVEPGGALHVADFGQQERLPRWFRGGLRAWLAKFHVTPRAHLFDAGRRAALAHGGAVAEARLYRGYAWAMTISR